MNGNDDTTFGRWLKERRKSLDLTQEELADRIGCSPWTITKIETGERRPSKQLVELLSEQLQIPEQERANLIRLARIGQANAQNNSQTKEPQLAANAHPTLSTPLTPIIGRGAEIAALRHKLLLEKARLITLTGAPGIGKTRLAVEVARSLPHDFEDGVFFIALASVRDASLVPDLIAQTLGLRIAQQTTVADLEHALQDKHMLLVLDNFEQLVDAGPSIADLLRACPHIFALVTSREALRVRGEEQFVVRPLGLPDLSHLPSVEHLSDYPAIELFLTRARSAKRDFALGEENAQTVASICAHLDGLPLAIELIAARIPLLPPWALLARLGSSLALLAGGPKDVPARHQTLSAAIRWSFDLLSEPEQRLMGRLAVFPGGCGLDGVEAMCSHDGDAELDVLDGLESLIYKSLVQRAEPRGREEPRYWMLQTIREYALERLDERGEEEEVMHHLARHYVQLAATAAPNLTGPNQKEWLDRLEHEHDNIRAALGWLTEQQDDLALKMVISLWLFWEIRGYLSEGRKWLDETLAYSGESLSAERARALHISSGLALRQGDYERAKELAQESLAISTTLADKQGTGRSLHALGVCEEMLGNMDRAETCYMKALGLWREVEHHANLGRTLNSLGVLARTQGDYDRAVELFSESLELHRKSGSKRSIALAMANLGTVAMARNNWEHAEMLFNQSLVLRREIGHKVGIGDCLIGLASVYGTKGDALKAVSLFGAATQLFQMIDYEMEPNDRRAYEISVDSMRAKLSAEEFETAWSEGEAMDLEDVICSALRQA